MSCAGQQQMGNCIDLQECLGLSPLEDGLIGDESSRGQPQQDQGRDDDRQDRADPNISKPTPRAGRLSSDLLMMSRAQHAKFPPKETRSQVLAGCMDVDRPCRRIYSSSFAFWLTGGPGEIRRFQPK